MTTPELLAKQFSDTREWTKLLVTDFSDEDWVFQPESGLHHALWLCGHLVTAEDTLIFSRSLNADDSLPAGFRAHFPIGGSVRSATEHDYPPAASVIATMDEHHAQTLLAIRGMSDSLLAEPAYAADGKSKHPHYADKLGVVSHLIRHEAFHAGQIGLLRRLMGKAALR